jgi:hypothetical protein
MEERGRGERGRGEERGRVKVRGETRGRVEKKSRLKERGRVEERSRVEEKGRMHCKEIWIYVFPGKELRGISLNFHIHVSVSDLYITTLGLPIVLQQNRQTDQKP